MSNVIDQPHALQENVGFHSTRLGAIIFVSTHTPHCFPVKLLRLMQHAPIGAKVCSKYSSHRIPV